MNTRVAYLLFMLSVSSLIKPIELIINQPGNYTLGDSIIADIAGTDFIISISANDVVFDCDRHVLSQQVLVGTVGGIIVQEGFSNIVIRNGLISNLTGVGISILSTTSEILIEDMQIENCALGAVNALGSLAGPIVNLSIKRCNFFNCQNAVAIQQAVSLHCQQIVVATVPGGIAFTANGDGGVLDAITVQNSTIGAAFALGLSDALIRNCVSQGNSNPFGGNFIGFDLGSGSVGCAVINCSVIGCSSAAAQFFGFIHSLANNFKHCLIYGNQGTNATGFFGDTIISPIQMTYQDCIASANNATTGFVRALRTFASAGSYINCIGSFNTAATQSSGLFFESTASNWTVRNSIFVDNTGPTAADSFGVDGATDRNLFDNVVGFRGTTAVYEL
jgi:hypothetical protein